MTDDGVPRRIMHCARQLERLAGRDLSPLGLGSGRVRLLLDILENPGETQESLSLHAGVDKTTTAKAVKRLEAAGYVQRRPAENDRRLRCLFPTDSARALRPDLMRRLRLVHEILLQGFLETEISRLSGYLSRMLENLDRNADQNGFPDSRPVLPTTGWD
ncbi:MAG: MarR family transcriptional regulator [Candidatus Aminicenantes bacterium]|nr:MarR family transcriptional regulator [Candidatus Aminicenantes bacterium]